MTIDKTINARRLFAVIDLETTGTNFENGDRIIQFGCALMQDGEIKESISQLINPDMPIPPVIQQLTGISSQTLVTAPFFEEVAAGLRGLLEDCVIVAHNINFDYHFLSAAFESAGLAPLTQPAVDTVELAQILLPTAPSFRLSDLSEHFGIRHAHPHRADSDARATAELLWQLRARFQALPEPLQSELAELGCTGLTRETGAFLAGAITHRPLKPNELAVGRFVLQRPDEPTRPLTDERLDYPATLAAKKKLLTPRYRLRAQQAHLMDAIYEHETTQDGPLLIEAGTGLGKSFGYLLPFLSLASPKQPLVVATATTVLQRQLLERDIPALAALTGRTIAAIGFQGARHYIDLDAFDASLAQEDINRLTRILQLRLLVWLSETQTGDFSELRLTSYRAPLFQAIQHSGTVKPHSRYADVDFVTRQHAVGRAPIIVTNHAYLAHHVQELTRGSRPFLVVDEAQHFPDTVRRANHQSSELVSLYRWLGRLREVLSHGSQPIIELFDASSNQAFLLRSLIEQLDPLQGRITRFQEAANKRLFDNGDDASEQLLTGEAAKREREELVSFRATMTRRLEALAMGLDPVLTEASEHADRFTLSEQQQLKKATDLQDELHDLIKKWGQAIAEGQPLTVHIVEARAIRTLDYRWDNTSPQQAIQALLKRFEKPLFIGATLTAQRDFNFLTRQLGYGPLPEGATLRFRSPFHYRDQAKVFVDETAPNAQTTASGAYADYLANTIARLADNTHQTLALFNSLETIQQVYERLMRMSVSDHKEILAQGVTGSPEKITKRFALSDNALLLGAASFFEGVDFPDKQLEIVILTRLPFDSPDSLEAKERELAFKATGEDVFSASVLPRATLKFRQAFGRLIRTERDRGLFIVLDARLTNTKYGRQMQKSLPNLKPYIFDTNTMITEALTWLDAGENEKEGPHEKH